MAPDSRFLRPFRRSREARAIPDRVQEIVARFEGIGERMIGWVQLAVGLAIAGLYALARRPVDAPMADLDGPVPIGLAIYLAFTCLRLILAHRGHLPRWFLALSIVVDVATLYGVIWSTHLQYGQNAGFYLKTPSFAFIFVFIAIRALRFEPGWVLATGAAAAVGWLGLTIYAVEFDGMAMTTRSYVDYIHSDRILIGAEVAKLFAIGAFSAVLALTLSRAKRLLATAVRDQVEREEIRRFLPADVERAITEAPKIVLAGDAMERDAAIVMLDIRGFSAFLHSREPETVVAILVELHARIVPVIQRHGGIVDKYLGDGLLATFGASRPSPTPAADALQALDEIMATAAAWSGEVADEYGFDLRVNGAATSGRIVFTALGDDERLEYTVIGDAVNLAAKLEKHNKQVGSAALTTEETLADAKRQGFKTDKVTLGRLARSSIQGVEEPMDLVVLAA